MDFRKFEQQPRRVFVRVRVPRLKPSRTIASHSLSNTHTHTHGHIDMPAGVKTAGVRSSAPFVNSIHSSRSRTPSTNQLNQLHARANARPHTQAQANTHTHTHAREHTHAFRYPPARVCALNTFRDPLECRTINLECGLSTDSGDYARAGGRLAWGWGDLGSMVIVFGAPTHTRTHTHTSVFVSRSDGRAVRAIRRAQPSFCVLATATAAAPATAPPASSSRTHLLPTPSPRSRDACQCVSVCDDWLCVYVCVCLRAQEREHN